MYIPSEQAIRLVFCNLHHTFEKAGNIGTSSIYRQAIISYVRTAAVSASSDRHEMKACETVNVSQHVNTKKTYFIPKNFIIYEYFI